MSVLAFYHVRARSEVLPGVMSKRDCVEMKSLRTQPARLGRKMPVGSTLKGTREQMGFTLLHPDYNYRWNSLYRATFLDILSNKMWHILATLVVCNKLSKIYTIVISNIQSSQSCNAMQLPVYPEIGFGSFPVGVEVEEGASGGFLYRPHLLIHYPVSSPTLSLRLPVPTPNPRYLGQKDCQI